MSSIGVKSIKDQAIVATKMTHDLVKPTPR
jgi:hypothetical protein